MEEKRLLNSVKEYFKRELDKGHVPNFTDLLHEARRLSPTGSVSNRQVKSLRNLKKQWLETLVHEPESRRQKLYQRTFVVPNFGLVQGDAVFMDKRHTTYNDGAIGYFLLVNVVTGLCAAEPLYGKAAADYSGAITAVVKQRRMWPFHTMETDHDPSLTAKLTRRQMRLLRIRQIFLGSWTKASVAEALALKLSRNMTIIQMRRGTKRWRSILADAVKYHNDERVPRTSFVRSSINPMNFLRFLDELLSPKSETNFDATMTFNTGRITYESLKAANWAEDVFAFKPGDPVLVVSSKEKIFAIRGKRLFTKKSRSGIYSPRVYVIAKAELRSTKRISGTMVDGEDLAAERKGYITALKRLRTTSPSKQGLTFQCTSCRGGRTRLSLTAGSTDRT